MTKSPNNRGLTITSRLLIWFLVIAFLPLLIVTSISYYLSVKHLENQATNHLTAVADNKADQIESYFKERKANVSSLSYMPGISDALARLATEYHKSGYDSPESQAIDKEVRPFMTYYKEEAGYYDIFLIGIDGDIDFTVVKEADYHTNLKTGPYKDSQLAKVFDSACTLMQTEISSFEFYGPSNKPAAFIAAPIIRDGVVVGVVAVQINNDELYSIVNDYTGLGKTGEVIVARKADKEAVFTAPSRHEPDVTIKRKVGFGSNKGLPIQKAVKGGSGFGSDVDYRGNEVLAAWRYVPSIQWGLVVKIDTPEAFASVDQLRTAVVLLAIITLIAVVLAAMSIAKSFSEPIKKLMRTTELIASGDFSTPVEIKSKGEIGQLASNFNTMLTGLKESRHKNETQDWLKTGQTQLNDQLRGEKETVILCQNIITYIANYLNAQVGAIYLVEEENDRLQLISSYAYTKSKNISNSFAFGEGLVGQAAIKKESIHLVDVPEDYITVSSGLGRTLPRNIMLLPFLLRGEVVGIIELGSLDVFSDLHIEFLHQVLEPVAIAVMAAKNRVKTQELLERTQAQSEELQSQQEELKSSNEELEQQAKWLKSSEEQLQAQQQELEATNAQLEENAAVLEEQRQELRIS